MKFKTDGDSVQFVQPRLPASVAAAQDYMRLELYLNVTTRRDNAILYWGDVGVGLCLSDSFRGVVCDFSADYKTSKTLLPEDSVLISKICTCFEGPCLIKRRRHCPYL